jgi:hypothetical protein
MLRIPIQPLHFHGLQSSLYLVLQCNSKENEEFPKLECRVTQLGIVRDFEFKRPIRGEASRKSPYRHGSHPLEATFL